MEFTPSKGPQGRASKNERVHAGMREVVALESFRTEIPRLGLRWQVGRDTAFWSNALPTTNRLTPSESGVALRFPPQSMTPLLPARPVPVHRPAGHEQPAAFLPRPGELTLRLASLIQPAPGTTEHLCSRLSFTCVSCREVCASFAPGCETKTHIFYNHLRTRHGVKLVCR